LRKDFAQDFRMLIACAPHIADQLHHQWRAEASRTNSSRKNGTEIDVIDETDAQNFYMLRLQ